LTNTAVGMAKLNCYQLQFALLKHERERSNIKGSRLLTMQDLLSKRLNKYATTEKGFSFLELFAQFNDLLEEFTSLLFYGHIII
jgi:hypothetical protein